MEYETKAKSEWYREYDLVEARKQGSQRDPAAHQSRSLHQLNKWYSAQNDQAHGGILVLPTGAGKTFTATHFLCRQPVSQGRKVLWLAHTHHLLEQAFEAFEHAIPLIAETKGKLNIRVVSGTTGHFKAQSIRPSDDIVVCSIQTASRALAKKHPHFEAFLRAAQDELFVVFDEAHHSPANSYRKFLNSLREYSSNLSLLGLTATPTYSNEKKRGWLAKLFPQKIIHQEETSKLMAAGVLSKPILEEAQTSFEPTFDDREYSDWVSSFRDLPEKIIKSLASNRERNQCIADYYANNQEKYGKTIIFTDRWYQCEQLREALEKRGVRSDVVYSHVDADPGGADARNRRTADENAKVLRRFKSNELEVLINVRMLTEGTDVPDVQSVFMTRQTTSQILLTQMVGRALRGAKFGGTEKAYIVSFIDQWKQHINWATYGQIAEGLAEDSSEAYGTQPPLQFISIELVRNLAQQMDSGVHMNPAPYLTMLPIGWFRVEYETQVQSTDTDDVEQVDSLVLVFDGQKSNYDQFIEYLKQANLEPFESVAIDQETLGSQVDHWVSAYFESPEEAIAGLDQSMLAIARHMGQSDRTAPRFFPFTSRDKHDLDQLAARLLNAGLNRIEEEQTLRNEYTRQDCLWNSLYYNYDLFKSHYNGCIERLIHARQHNADEANHKPVFENTESVPDREASEETKKEVRSRDGKCLCCGVTSRLEVDHISPNYYGGKNHIDNLQILCSICNKIKDTHSISFRTNRTTLSSAPTRVELFSHRMPKVDEANEPSKWERYLRRCVNFYYGCAAVESIAIGARGEKYWTWEIDLYQGNNPAWFEPHLEELVQRIQTRRQEGGNQVSPKQIVIKE